MAGGKVVVPDVIKEADEEQSFAAFCLVNFAGIKYTLLEVLLSDNG